MSLILALRIARSMLSSGDIQVPLNQLDASLSGIFPCILMAVETFVNLSPALSLPSSGIPTLHGNYHLAPWMSHT